MGNNFPEELHLRDTALHDDMGGLGQRIFTTAGQGYHKERYLRADKVEARIHELKESERYQRDLANQMDAARVKAEHLGRLDRERAHELEAERDRLQADLDALNYDGMLTLRAECDRLREAIKNHRRNHPDEPLENDYVLWAALEQTNDT